MTQREEKMKAHIQSLAADFINKSVKTDSLITVTKASVAPNLRKATIYITVYPTEKEERALKEIKQKASEFRDFAGNHIHTKYIPFFEFDIDVGERKRQRIDQITGSA